MKIIKNMTAEKLDNMTNTLREKVNKYFNLKIESRTDIEDYIFALMTSLKDIHGYEETAKKLETLIKDIEDIETDDIVKMRTFIK